MENLEAACGGVLNPETLERFQQAMREYEVFMAGLSVMLAPVPTLPEQIAAAYAASAHYEALLTRLED